MHGATDPTSSSPRSFHLFSFFKKRRGPLFLLKRSGGAALLMSIFILNLVMFLALEISNQSINEYLASSVELKKVQSYHAARACYQLALLRVKAYQSATAQVDSLLNGKAPPPGLSAQLSQLDKIWQFPLAWPLPLPEGVSSFDKSQIQSAVGESLLKREFTMDITPEGARVDINDLGSPSKALRERTRRQLLDRLTAKVENGDDAFSNKYSNFDFGELLNNIADWVDEDTTSLNGGPENGLYTDFRNEFYPPNRPFKTKKELHMVAGMTDDIYAFLEPEMTLFGAKGINVNKANDDVLLSLFSRFPPEDAKTVVQEIRARISDPNLGGPFSDAQEFVGFITQYNIDEDLFNEERIPLFFGSVVNFKVNCNGAAGRTFRNISAVVYGGDAVGERLKSALQLDQKNNNPQDQCLELSGQEKWECQCDSEPAGTKKAQCIANKKKADQTNGQGKKKNSKKKDTKGPPKVIRLQVE